jgi:NAD(P)-dependent dehydrogenase (short-subunit alcohol dehydrogenase family)
MGRLDGRVVVVTGAGSGIGRATALRLASEGAVVACLDLVEETAQKAASEAAGLAPSSAPSRAYRVDVSDEVAVGEVVERVAGDLGAPSGLANIAGIGKFAHTTEVPKEEWDRIIAVNLTGTFLMCRAVLPHLLSTNGSIVNISSTAGLMGQPYSAAYCASKGGVSLLTKALALEYIERGVRVNAVAPGGIETPILGDFTFPEGASERLFSGMISPLGFGKPEDVAVLVAFLLSEESRYMTGTIVSVDGGMTI